MRLVGKIEKSAAYEQSEEIFSDLLATALRAGTRGVLLLSKEDRALQ
jgi:hypothetical protein